MTHFYSLTVWLVSIFSSASEYTNPRFTTLCNQMLSFARFEFSHVLFPTVIFCTPHLLINCMRRTCVSAVLWQNLIKHAPNIHPDVFNSFYETVIHGESLGIFTNPPPSLPQTEVPKFHYKTSSKPPPKQRQDLNKKNHKFLDSLHNNENWANWTKENWIRTMG